MKKDCSISDIEKVLHERADIVEFFKIIKDNPALIKEAAEMLERANREKELLDDLMLEQQEA